VGRRARGSALEQEQLEAYVATKIRAGEPLKGNYPPGDELKAEYKAPMADTGGAVAVRP